MKDGPYSPYTRRATWAALFSQHINAGFAIVPNSLTSNSLVMIAVPPSTSQMAQKVQDAETRLLEADSELARFFKHGKAGERLPPLDQKAPAMLRNAQHVDLLRVGVVLGKSSDYYRYQLASFPDINLIVCALHDSYLHIPVWETRSNRIYEPRETSAAIDAPGFAKLRTTAYGHKILLGALICGDEKAIAFKKTLNARTQRRINAEVRRIQTDTYQGRPLTFIDETKTREIGAKISRSLFAYHARKRRA